ncbi:serine/threonine-protein kinase [Nannocystis punicea]|uniref:Serine/threonine-protein kinase n=1 Tax=Nannocystis punicea TaxID=2995304 RepID=A0ABY7HK55_9BACT|nr:serine/threonine-protein kinase [Nannocystis poenicansa]WAS99319.1 serine/threonine-protein kinase [Nannocystis poenicansa]
MKFTEEQPGETELAEAHETSTMHTPLKADTRVGVLLADRYRIMDRLGKGGMAAVYRAVDRQSGMEYAIKFLDRRFTADPDMGRRCQREARTMAEIESRHVPRAFMVGTTPENEIYFVMEFLRGRDLDQVLTREGPLPWRRAASIGLQLCEALAAAHARNIIHRDVKPSNCFLVEGGDGGEDFVKLIDFGIAKDLDASGEQTGLGLVLGTPGYVAPELLAGESRASPGTDVYGLGVTIYKLMTGRLPWQPGSAGDMTYAQMHEAPRPLHDHVRGQLPVTVEAAVMQAFERDPSRRFRSVEEVTAALRLALEEPRAVPPSGSALREAAVIPASATGPSWRREAAIAAAIAAALFGGAWTLAPVDKPGRGGSGRVPLAAVRPTPTHELLVREATAQVEPTRVQAAPPVVREAQTVAQAAPAQAPSVEAPADSAAATPPAAPVEAPVEVATAPPTTPPAPARPFSASKVETLLDRRLTDLRVCAPPGADRLRFTLLVAPDGAVAGVQASPASFRQCIADQLDGATFPASDGGGELEYAFRAKDAPKPAGKPAPKPKKTPPKDAMDDDLLPVGGK